MLNHMEYGDFTIESTPYGYIVREWYRNRSGDKAQHLHHNRYTGDVLHFGTIKAAMSYIDAQGG